MREKLKANAHPIFLPIGKEENFSGLVDLVQNQAYSFDEDPSDVLGMNPKTVPIPAAMVAEAKEYRDKLIEAVSDFDDVIAEKYLSGEEITVTIKGKKMKGFVASGPRRAFDIKAFSPNNKAVVIELTEFINNDNDILYFAPFFKSSLRIGGVQFDVHSLLFSSLAIIAGYQSLLFAVLTKTFAISQGLLPADERMTKLWSVVTLERGLIAATATMLAGVGLLAGAVAQWWARDFGPLVGEPGPGPVHDRLRPVLSRGEQGKVDRAPGQPGDPPGPGQELGDPQQVQAEEGQPGEVAEGGRPARPGGLDHQQQGDQRDQGQRANVQGRERRGQERPADRGGEQPEGRSHPISRGITPAVPRTPPIPRGTTPAARSGAMPRRSRGTAFAGGRRAGCGA